MLSLIILVWSAVYLPEHSPLLFQTYWLHCVCEIVIEMITIHTATRGTR